MTFSKRVMAASVSAIFVSLAAISPASAQVVALGASNTEGKGRGKFPDGVPRSQAWPAQLERMLNAQGCRVKVRNAGIAGDTTQGMLRRLPPLLTKGTKVLILQPGGNDARRGMSGRGANISAIRAQAEARGVRVVMLEALGRIAGAHRLPDGQHFSAQGHVQFAAYLAPQVRAAGACG